MERKGFDRKWEWTHWGILESKFGYIRNYGDKKEMVKRNGNGRRSSVDL